MKQSPVNWLLKAVRKNIPEGRALPERAWRVRHRGILALVWVHAFGLAAFGFYQGYGLIQSTAEGAVIAAIALVASNYKFGRSFQSSVASLGLVTSSAILVQFSGGYIEAHFHFFVMLAVISIYQNWIPYILAVAFVAVDHGLTGQFVPMAVYNHPDAFAHPWRWAFIHAGFVLGESVALLAGWLISEQARARIDLLLNSAGEGILGVDLSGKITFANPAAANMTDYSLEALVGQPVNKVWQEPAEPSENGGDRHLVRDLKKRQSAEKVMLRRDGTLLSVASVSNPIRERGEVVGSVVTVKDETERKEAEKTIRHMAFYDTLTELPNRNMLYDRLLNAIREAENQGKPVALLLMDLDHFKEINDTLGHQRGDLLLREMGSRLKKALFEPDTVARLGGDEFTILLPRLAKVEDIYVVIRKIQDALLSPFILEGQPIAVEASIGVAIYPDHGKNADSLLQCADVAMYAAKKTGSGYLIYDVKHDQRNPRRLALIGELRQAIEKDELVLYYQPKISFKTHRVIGVEALVRWQHPKYGFVPPDQFILPAEHTGLIHPLTRWVLKSALHQSKEWNIPVSVNLSARNLHDPQLEKYIKEILQAAGGSPEDLELEITESAIMVDPQRALEAIVRLRAIGLRFALDDFGVGYSSLAYLKKLPVDTIKIDKSFVLDMAKSEDDVVIVLSTINLGHNLGRKVVAEGVETETIWNQLLSFGCDAAQGYYMSKPLPAADLIGWLKKSPWGLKQPAGSRSVALQ